MGSEMCIRDRENAGELFACENIDGALVGGASLEAESFWKIAQAASAGSQ